MTLSFNTARLTVTEITSDITFSKRAILLTQVPNILTPAVVENLPPYFHDIHSSEMASLWLERMLSESRLLIVQLTNDEIIGFIFAYVENNNEVHIGYLLAQPHWGKGLASEMLQGFIAQVKQSMPWRKLIGGVDRSNKASAHLLKKLGFVEQDANEGNVIFYQLRLFP